MWIRKLVQNDVMEGYVSYIHVIRVVLMNQDVKTKDVRVGYMYKECQHERKGGRKGMEANGTHGRLT